MNNFFKVRWGDIAEDYKKAIMPGFQGEPSPIKFYFEENKRIFMFMRLRGAFVYAEVIPQDATTFKMEYCTHAFELQENPLSPKKKMVVATRSEPMEIIES